MENQKEISQNIEAAIKAWIGLKKYDFSTLSNTEDMC